jgi:hypothetical protein
MTEGMHIRLCPAEALQISRENHIIIIIVATAVALNR